jgi:hypothetical protein
LAEGENRIIVDTSLDSNKRYIREILALEEYLGRVYTTRVPTNIFLSKGVQPF